MVAYCQGVWHVRAPVVHQGAPPGDATRLLLAYALQLAVASHRPLFAWQHRRLCCPPFRTVVERTVGRREQEAHRLLLVATRRLYRSPSVKTLLSSNDHLYRGVCGHIGCEQA